MGKRELLLVFGFVIIGMVVYQATAKPPASGERGLSISRFLESARRELRGNRANAEATTTATHPIDSAVNELRIVGSISDVEITGEDRKDVETTAHVESNGYDEAEAREYVKQSKVVADQTAASLILRMEFPSGGRQRGTLRVKVPSRMRVRIEPGSGALKVTNVAAVELAGTRGSVKLQKIQGKVEISHRGGEVELEDVGSLDVSGRIGTLKVTTVRGDASIRMEQGGEMTASQLFGAVEIEGRNCDITLDDLATARGPIRVNAMGGTVKMKGVKGEARVDGRNAEIEVALGAPAPVAIFSEGDRVTVTPPSGGYTLDARVIDGRVTPDDFVKSMGFSSTRTEDGKETRVSGAIKGGGPTISVRATRADFTLRSMDEAPKAEEKPGATVPPRLKSTLK